ncbi:MAG: glutamate-ammonia-ligase adenylyltransferase [Gammaproteobacteria bacterium]|jgi:glutamate-ammonia-ligase adenylyltransferase
MTTAISKIHPLLVDDQYHWRQIQSIFESDDYLLDRDLQHKIERLAISSSYALIQICRNPSLLLKLNELKQFDLEKNSLVTACDGSPDIATTQKILRQYRHAKLIEIIYLDVVNNISLKQTLIQLSNLADQLIKCALAAAEKHLIAKHGQPLDTNNNPITLNVIAMGKLGGQELNFSSDIDLICSYANEGELSGFGHLAYQEFFTRVVRLFAKLLNDTTEDGFVYRVDLRLRPWGKSGPVALHHMALEHYYQLHGREWEQYAMVKARIITGSDSDREYLNSILTPFVYRKYHDYRVFEGLASLKDQIDNQAKSKIMRDNIKVGSGGIREIEFFVQAFQILKGGRNKRLQSQQIFICFKILQSQNIVDSKTIEVLRKAYIFLRRLENRIQMIGDEQLHSCPHQPLVQARIAHSLNLPDWPAVQVQLDAHRARVSYHFNELFKADVEADNTMVITDTIGDEKMDSQKIELMQSFGIHQASEINQKLAEFFASNSWGFMSAKAKQRFTRLLPDLLKSVSQTEDHPVLFARLLKLFSSIAGRSVYFELLYQNIPLLKNLVQLFDQSEWIAQEVAQYPMLLEHLIQVGDADKKFDRDQIADSLKIQLDNVVGDTELELDVLRLFKREQTIVIAIAELSEEISAIKVSQYLSELAEIILHAVYLLASSALQNQYGMPFCTTDNISREANFAIIGYGKLGGKEMHYRSDLDVIFLHDSSGTEQVTNGTKSIDNNVYFARLAQKIISMTSILTSSGKLYEIDSRLRPEGASGLLVSSDHAYLKYQLDKAWTWEHQALVRARYVAGCQILEPVFKNMRTSILSIHRDPQKLVQDIVKMRDKISYNKGPKQNEICNIKYSKGCMVDIEFMVQYWVLLHANKVSSISAYSDNIGLIKELFRLNLISSKQYQLVDIYQTYHHLLHRTVLQNNPAVIASDLIAEEVEHVNNCWDECFG